MYDRTKALEYAKIYYNSRNPQYYAFDNIGGDCTNYVCQCLHAGGIEMNYNINGWFYVNLNNRSTSWSGVNEFYQFAANNRDIGVRAREVDIADLLVGDVVQLGNDDRFYHTLLISKIVYPISVNNIFVTAHDRNAYDRNLNSYVFKRVRYLHIIN